MNNELAEAVQKRMVEVMAFRAALSSESDRGCALFAAAYLDEALKELLTSIFVPSGRQEAELFKGTAPLSSFSARIKMAYYLSLISGPVRRDLDLIRKIRNDFAHDAQPLTFDDEPTATRCTELGFSHHKSGHRARGHYTSAALRVLGEIHVAEMRAVQTEEASGKAPPEKMKEATRQRVQSMIDSLLDNESGDSDA